MTPKFRIAYERTAGFEGGWSDDPNDRGGKTKYGITEKTWLAHHAGHPPCRIDQITPVDAQDIFFEDYWCKSGCNRLEATSAPQALLNALFDAAVHHGPRTAAKMLQEAFNLVCYNWALLVVDGDIGPRSINSIDSFCRKVEYGAALCGAMAYVRGKKFAEIQERDKSQREYIGWWVRL